MVDNSNMAGVMYTAGKTKVQNKITDFEIGDVPILDEPAKKKKRGPGRPRKYPKEDPNKPKRPVGRPRKPKLRQPIQISSPRRELTYSQQVLRGLFNDKNQMWNNGENRVQINETLTSGSGLIKNGDRGQTARMFGGWRR